jgi:hypothetical protein
MSDLLASLENASLEDLREEWGRRFGAPPRLRSPDLVRRILAWRIQVAAEGGFDRRTRRLLLGNGAGKELHLQLGTVIAREWEGIRHEVQVTEDGFLHAGKSFRSLSGVARAITGTRWNGPRFFGLRKQK